MPTIQTTAKTVDTALALEFRDAICSEFNYQDTIDGQPNPETKNQFAQRQLDTYSYEWAKNVIRSYRRRNKPINETVDL